MKIINHFLFKTTNWLEKNSLLFAKFQNQRRFKKWDTAPCPLGINSYTNPHIYQFLIDRRNTPSLSDFELDKLLLLFSFEKFSLVTKDEFDHWLIGLNPKYLNENINDLKAEMIELASGDEKKYLPSLISIIVFSDIISQLKTGRKGNGEDPIRNIKKLFCELRILLNKHILAQDQK